jgi:anionic cell wall polymer biosynthesis LytR-Cps2A-Psr (LCP) family protein
MSEENRTSSNDHEDLREERRRRAQKRRKKRRTRNIAVFVVELLLLLVVIVCGILLAGLDKMMVQLDPGAVATNEAAGNSASSSDITAVTQTDAEGNTVVVEMPDTTVGETQASVTADPTVDQVEYTTSFEGRYTTIVVFGMDGRGEVDAYASGSNSDVIILVVIDNETGEIRMSSIYRDSVMKFYTDVKNYKHYNKANYAICQYGVVSAMSTLNTNLDLNIDYFVCVDWEATAELINAIGGVDIVLEKKFWETTDEYGNKVPYFNGELTEIVNSTGIDSAAIPQEYFNGSEWHADGPQAVAYMRMRYGDSDIQRTARQREVIDQVITKAKTADFATLYKIWLVVQNSIKMNLSETDVLALLQNISKYHFSADNGSMGYPVNLYDGADYPASVKNNSQATQWMVIPVNVVENVKKLHEFLYPEEDYTPSNALYQIDEEIRKFALFDENWEPTFYTEYYGK